MRKKQKSNNDRSSQARPATSNKLEQTGVGPALAPEGGARSQQFKPENWEPPTSGSPPTPMIKP